MELKSEISLSNFDLVYPKEFQELSKIHWTPTAIIELSVEWLTHEGETNLLDIGSGVGKFCHVGALLSDLKFNGVEKRKNLYETSVKVKNELKLKNVEFINKNITDVEFNAYNSFYYFNPFCEQLASADWIDKTVTFSEEKDKLYTDYVHQQLAKLSVGARVVTYCSKNDFIPDSYRLINMNTNGFLELWIKVK
jgi:predicted RNA methylase